MSVLTQVLMERKGSMAIDTLMYQIGKMGAGLESHDSRAFSSPEQTVIRQLHDFEPCQGRSVCLRSLTVCKQGPWMGVLTFSTDVDITPRAVETLWGVIDYFGYVNILETDDSGALRLGGFFSRQSTLRNLLSEEIRTMDLALSSGEISQKIWNIISKNGGLRSLLDIWDDLYDEIQFRMRLEDPYIFD